MFLKNLIILTLLAVALPINAKVSEKKIELEDIEQDNLNSERAKDGKSDGYSKSSGNADPNSNYGRSPVSHQYDVEESNAQDTPGVVYATGNNYTPQEQQQYVEVNNEHDGTSEKYEPQYQNNIEQHTGEAPINYVAAMPMQIIYVHQYDPSSSNHVSNYANQYQQQVQVPSYYYQPNHQQEAPQSYAHGKQKYVEEDEKQTTHEAAPQKQNPYINYVTVPNHSPHLFQLAPVPVPGYILSMQYQEQPESVPEKNVPHHAPNFAAYHQSYVNNAQDNQLKYISAPITNHVTQVLPQYAHEISRPIYSHISGKLVHDNSEQSYPRQNNLLHLQKPSHHSQDGFDHSFGQYVKRKPSSLLESYIPSSIQIEYLKRGLSKEPLSTYDAVAYSQGFPVKNFERGFLPNQMYPTAAGGVTFAHFKRDVKEKPK